MGRSCGLADKQGRESGAEITSHPRQSMGAGAVPLPRAVRRMTLILAILPALRAEAVPVMELAPQVVFAAECIGGWVRRVPAIVEEALAPCLAVVPLPGHGRPRLEGGAPGLQ